MPRCRRTPKPSENFCSLRVGERGRRAEELHAGADGERREVGDGRGDEEAVAAAADGAVGVELGVQVDAGPRRQRSRARRGSSRRRRRRRRRPRRRSGCRRRAWAARRRGSARRRLGAGGLQRSAARTAAAGATSEALRIRRAVYDRGHGRDQRRAPSAASVARAALARAGPALRAGGRARAVPAGEDIVVEGSLGDSLYLILSGAATVHIGAARVASAGHAQAGRVLRRDVARRAGGALGDGARRPT